MQAAYTIQLHALIALSGSMHAGIITYGSTL